MNMKANEIGQIQVGYFSNFYDRVPKHTTLDNCLTCIPQYLKDNFEHLRQIKDESEQKKEKLKWYVLIHMIFQQWLLLIRT